MGLPQQRIAFSLKGKDWQRETINYYETLSYGTNSSNRNTNTNKKINYDLFNGKFNKADLEYVCNPLGVDNNEFPATLQHYDIVSPPLNLLIGEETKRNDNCIVISGSTNDINRKQSKLKDKIIAALQEQLMAEIDPASIDPNNPPPTPEEILKYEKHNISDLIESQANKILKFLKRYLNTKEIFKKGWKDVLIAGEEIYWTGISNNDVTFRRVNPLNVTIILDGDTDYIDDAIAVVEVRMLAPATILDEFGDKLTPSEVADIEAMATGYTSSGTSYSNNNPGFTLEKDGSIGAPASAIGSSFTGNYSSNLVRVVRVEWKSFKKLYHLTYTDEDGILQEQMVDESFKLTIFKQSFPDAAAEEFWINEAWEGIRIGADIYVDVKPKENQRRRMDNPYYCKLGYVGLLYNSTNTQSVSLLDRLKPYQYLYNIISYRLELAFASDQGKIMLMDLAQIPRSEGMDIDRWMYYMKAMKIAFINSHEEGKKGTQTGKISTFNQFQSIDLSLANQIQQYIATLDYIKQQIAFISGVSPQRLGAINNQELVGNVERSVQQSALITEYLFDSHDEVKRRVYTALVECAKLAFKDGLKTQYVLDDMGIELLDIEELELENSEFNVFMSNSNKDLQIVETLKQLAQGALQADKADLSTIIDTLINDSPKDIVRTIQKGEAAKYARDKAMQDQQAEIQQQQVKAQQEATQMMLEDKQKDRDIKQYEIDANNQTKIEVATLNTLRGKDGPSDMDMNGIPDAIEVGKLALDRQDIETKAYMEGSKLKLEKDKHDKEMSLKEKELSNKREIEDRKIKAIDHQSKNQEKMQEKELAFKEKELVVKERMEKLKAAAAKAKAKQKPKK
jgi:hypothetical protein